MNIQIPVYILICLLGVVIGLQLQDSAEQNTPAPSVPAETPGTGKEMQPLMASGSSAAQIPPDFHTQLQNHRAMLELLESQLGEERKNRLQLEKQLQSLLARADSVSTSSEVKDQPHTDNTNTTTANVSSNNGNWFNEQALVTMGFTTDKASFLRQKFEEREMQRLYLRDQAAREGWLNTDRYRQARSKLSDSNGSLRQELSEQEYDAYLYAAGRPNRVLVNSTMQTSPAAKAGIQAGDTILRYGDSRIYSWRDLREATSQGEAGSMVMVTLLRNGIQQQVYVPRGPLGVQLNADSVVPDN